MKELASGHVMPASAAKMAMTTSISIRVKPRFFIIAVGRIRYR